MSAQKTHTLTLGKHTEQVTQAELDQIKKTLGPRFSEYEVSPIQPVKPADVQTDKEPKKLAPTT